MSTLAIRPLNLELQAIAKEQLNEEPEKIEEILKVLKEWIKKSPHLLARTDDQFLVTFLRGCKYSLERVKQKMDLYYTLRTHIPELFSDRDPFNEKMQAIIKLGIGLPLPSASPGSPRIMLFRFGAYDATVYTIQEIMKVTMMLIDILMLEDDNLAVAGQSGVIDLAGVTVHHFMQMQPSLMKKMSMMGQDASPIRQKGVHYINAPKSFEKIFNVLKGFLNEKMKSRVRRTLLPCKEKSLLFQLSRFRFTFIRLSIRFTVSFHGS